MVTISARTFRYSRRLDETMCIRYYFVDQHNLTREWVLIHWNDTPLWQGVKMDKRRSPDFPHRVILPTQLQHALMAALLRHRRIVAAANDPAKSCT
jgi:hypothetical protein